MKNLLKRIFKGKFNNKGMSLVELICAIGIMSLLGASVAGVLVVSSNSYTRGVSDVELQQDAQLLVNQINNLIQDAKNVTTVSDGDNTILSITKMDGTDYVVSLDGNTMKVQSNDVVTHLHVEQPLAENVSMFVCDSTDFYTNGVVQMYISMDKGSRNYAGNYTVAARNTKVNPTVRESNINITCDSEIIMEPNEAKLIPVTVVGATVDEGIEWELHGNNDSNTTLLEKTPNPGDPPLPPGAMNLELKIGKDENVNEFVALIKSKQKKADGVTPAAQKTIRVYVRRVTAVSMSGVYQSGWDKHNGASYKIDTQLNGLNLFKTALTSDSNYDTYSPYVVRFDFTYTDEGVKKPLTYSGNMTDGVIFSNDYCEIKIHNIDKNTMQKVDESSGTPVASALNMWDSFGIVNLDYRNSVDGGAAPYIDFKLKRDMGTTQQFACTVVCLHPNGVNRSNEKYVDSNIFAYWELNDVAPHASGLSLKRGSDIQVCSLSGIDSKKSIISARTGVADYNFALRKEWRYRPVTRDAEGNATPIGGWTNWMYMQENGWNQAVNLRPGPSLCLDPDKAYEIEIRWSIINRVNGNLLWPFPETLESEYMVKNAVMDPVTVYYKTSGVSGGILGSSGLPITAGQNIRFDLDRFEGIDQNAPFNGNSVSYVLQRLNKDGVWENVAERDGRVWKSQSDRFDWTINIQRNGEYRVLVYGNNLSSRRYEQPGWVNWNYFNDGNNVNNCYKENPKYNGGLYEEATGRGVFDFIVSTNTDDWNSRYMEFDGAVYTYEFGYDWGAGKYHGKVAGRDFWYDPNTFTGQNWEKDAAAKEKFINDAHAVFGY